MKIISLFHLNGRNHSTRSNKMRRLTQLTLPGRTNSNVYIYIHIEDIAHKFLSMCRASPPKRIPSSVPLPISIQLLYSTRPIYCDAIHSPLSTENYISFSNYTLKCRQPLHPFVRSRPVGNCLRFWVCFIVVHSSRQAPFFSTILCVSHLSIFRILIGIRYISIYSISLSMQ